MKYKLCAVCGEKEAKKDIKRVGCLNVCKDHTQHEEVINLYIRNDTSTTEQIRT